MMLSTPIQQHRQGRTSLWRQWLAVIAALVPMATLTLISIGAGDAPFSLQGFLTSSTLLWAATILLVLLLQRGLCHEPISALNQKQGSWIRDIWSGVLLALVTLLMLTLVQLLVSTWLPNNSVASMTHVFSSLSGSVGLALLFMGPMILLGVAAEELLRAFMLSRLWRIWPSSAGYWIAILFSAGIFGLYHLYQGLGGMLNAVVYGLVLGTFYLRYGRVWPMIIAHYSHDAVQIGLILSLVSAGIVDL